MKFCRSFKFFPIEIRWNCSEKAPFPLPSFHLNISVFFWTKKLKDNSFEKQRISYFKSVRREFYLNKFCYRGLCQPSLIPSLKFQPFFLLLWTKCIFLSALQSTFEMLKNRFWAVWQGFLNLFRTLDVPCILTFTFFNYFVWSCNKDSSCYVFTNCKKWPIFINLSK